MEMLGNFSVKILKKHLETDWGHCCAAALPSLSFDQDF